MVIEWKLLGKRRRPFFRFLCEIFFFIFISFPWAQNHLLPLDLPLPTATITTLVLQQPSPLTSKVTSLTLDRQHHPSSVTGIIISVTIFFSSRSEHHYSSTLSFTPSLLFPSEQHHIHFGERSSTLFCCLLEQGGRGSDRLWLLLRNTVITNGKPCFSG